MSTIAGQGIFGNPNPGTVQMFAYQHTPVSVGGTLNETALFTYTIPANMMGANGVLRITPLWTWTNSANTKTLKVKFSTTAFFNVGETTNALLQHIVIIRNRNATNSQICTPAASTGYGAATGGPITSTIDTTQDQTFTITGTTTLETGFTPTQANMSGNGATVTVIQTGHGLNSGEYVKAAGSSTAGYNADPVQVTRIDANTFTYSGTGTGTPTTSPTIQRYSVCQLESVCVEVIK